MTVRRAIGTLFAAAIGSAIVGEIDGFLTQMDWEEQVENHARFEGTWAPHELRRAKARRELEEAKREMRVPQVNHATAEGATASAV